MSLPLSYFVTLLEHYKYLILLPIAIIEGPIITIIAGFLVSLGILNFYASYAIVIAGDVIGDAIYYAIGRFGGRRFILKYGRFIGVTEESVQKAEAVYKDHLGKTIVISKITQAPILAVLVMAGVTKTDFKKFIWIIFLVTLVKALAFLLIGYYFGRSYQLIDGYINNSLIVGGIITAAAVLAYIVWIKLAKKK